MLSDRLMAMERSQECGVVALVGLAPQAVTALDGCGWSIERITSFEAARAFLRHGDWDVALIARDLPDGDGLALCAEARVIAPHRYLMVLSDVPGPGGCPEAFSFGADDCVTADCGLQELQARVRAGLRVASVHRFLLRMNVQLEELSLTDEITQVPNRRAFNRELESRFEVARRYERSLSLAILDVDHFKTINDRLGHDAGDVVLRAVAGILTRSTRRSDCVARIGGDEFAVILPETSLREAGLFVEKIRRAVGNALIQIGGRSSCVTISVGISSLPHSLFHDATEMLFAADQALFRAKRNGRDRAESENRRERERFARGNEPAGSNAHSQLLISH